MANFGLREMPVERDPMSPGCVLLSIAMPQDETVITCSGLAGPRHGVGYFYALTPVYLANRLQALLGVEQPIRTGELLHAGQFADGVTILVK